MSNSMPHPVTLGVLIGPVDVHVVCITCGTAWSGPWAEVAEAVEVAHGANASARYVMARKLRTGVCCERAEPAPVAPVEPTTAVATVAPTAPVSAEILDGARDLGRDVARALVVVALVGWIMIMLPVRIVRAFVAAWPWSLVALVAGMAFAWWGMAKLPAADVGGLGHVAGWAVVPVVVAGFVMAEIRWRGRRKESYSTPLTTASPASSVPSVSRTPAHEQRPRGDGRSRGDAGNGGSTVSTTAPARVGKPVPERSARS